MTSVFPRQIAAALVSSGLCLLAACDRGSAPAPSSDWVAKVGETSIPLSELQAEMDRHTNRGLRASPEKVLEEMILREALVARALHLGLDRSPEFTRAYQNLLIAELKKCELEPRLDALKTDPVPRTAKDQPQKSQATAPRAQIRLAILRQQTHAKTSPRKVGELKARLEEASAKAAQLPKTEPGFGALAVDHSDDQATRYRGGDLGWLAEDASKLSRDPAMLSAGFQLKHPGEISPVVEGADGLYVVRLLERRVIEPSTNKNADAVAQYRSHLEKRKEIERRFENEARGALTVTVNKEKLAQFRTVVENGSSPAPVLGF